MTAEEIMQALRHVAMGRVNTPEQQRLCEALAGLLETPEQRAEREMGANEIRYEMPAGGLSDDPGAGHPVVVPKRTRKKAD